MSETWPEYVRRVTAGARQIDIAAATGIDQTGISRWLRGRSTPSAEKVVAFARALNESPLEALIAAGYLAADDVSGVIVTRVAAPPAELATHEVMAQIRVLWGELEHRIRTTEEASTAPLVEQFVGVP